MKSFLVVFTTNNARIVKDPELIEALKSSPNAMLNPNLAGVRGCPPQYWKRDGDFIVAMTAEERLARELILEDVEADNILRPMVMPKEPELPIPAPQPSLLERLKRPSLYLAAYLLLLALSVGITHLLK